MSGNITLNNREILKAQGAGGIPAPLLLDASGYLKVNVAAGGGSGGTSSTFGAAFPGTGTAAGAKDASGNLASLNLDNSGNLKVSGSLTVGGTTDNSAFVAGTSTGTPQMGAYHSVLDTVTDGDLAITAITAKRAQHINLRDASGAELGVAAAPLQVSLANTAANATALKVDGSGVTQPISGTVSITANSSVNLNQIAGTTPDTNSGVKSAGTLRVVLATDQPQLTNALKVDGSAVTQPISGSVTVTQATAANLKVDLSGTGANATALKVDNSGVTQPVSGSVNARPTDGTNPITKTFDLDTGAGTEYQQGVVLRASASGGSIEIGTATNPIRVDPTGSTTQPISGTITANIGTSGSLALDATLTGGTAKSIVRGGAKGSTSAADVTSTASGANHQMLDVAIYDGSGNQITAFGGGTQYTNAAAQASPVGTVALGYDGSNVRALKTSSTGVLSVDGSAVTQPVSAASLPLPTGAATAAKQPALGTAGTASTDVITVQGIASMTALKVDGSAVTQPVSAASLPLPTGAATSAKQPALGTAGAAASDVLTVQGIASMTALKVDGSGVTQPVSGTVSITANSSVNVAQVGGTNVGTAASGIQRVGIAGSSNAALDATVGAGTAPANMLAVGGLYNSTAPAPTTGQSLALQLDQAGNQRIFPGISFAQLTGWTSATSLNSTQNIFTNSGAPAVLVQLDQTSTITGGAITFEVTYDGTNWVTVPAAAVMDPSSSSFAQISLPYTLQANTNKAFIITSNGWQGLRIKLSTAITGTATVTPYYALLPYDPAESVIAYSPTAANFQVTANAGTNLNTSALALETGGNLASVATNTTNIPNVVGTAASAIPSKLLQVGGSDGTNARAIKTNSSGQLDVRPLTSSDVVTANNSTAANLKAQVSANDATGSAVPANAFYQGNLAKTSLPSAATDGNLTGQMSDKFGRQVVLPGTIRDLIGTQTTTISASTSETTVVTAAASTFNDLMMLIISNTSATAARVDIRDTTAGSVLFSIYVPAGDVRGFSLGGVAIPQTSVNTNWTAQSSASVTDLRVYAVFAKNK